MATDLLQVRGRRRVPTRHGGCTGGLRSLRKAV